MHRRIVESELSTDHNITGNNGPNTNLFSEKLGKNCLSSKISHAHIKVNSASTSVNNTESKMHTRVGSSLKHSNIKKNNAKSLKNSYNNVNKDVSSTGSVVNNNHYNNNAHNNSNSSNSSSNLNTSNGSPNSSLSTKMKCKSKWELEMSNEIHFQILSI